MVVGLTGHDAAGGSSEWSVVGDSSCGGHRGFADRECDGEAGWIGVAVFRLVLYPPFKN